MRTLALLIPILLAASCRGPSEGMLASFIDLSSEYAQEGSRGDQNRVISVPGLLPPPAVGLAYHFHGKRGPTSMIGISPVRDSFYITTTIRSQASKKELQEAQRAFIEMRTKALSAIQARLDLARLRLQKNPGALAPAQKQAKTKNQASDRLRLQKNLSVLAQAQKEAEAKIQAFDRAYDKVLSKINGSGILIYRWSSKKSGSGALQLGGSLLGLGKNKNRTTSGFAFLAGLRTSTLYVGSDIKNQWPDIKSPSARRDLRLVTHLRQSKDILYMSDSQLASSLALRLSASYKQLAGDPEALQALDRIDIDSILIKVENVSNAGWIGPVERQILPAPWNGDFSENLFTILQDCDSWNTFYFVDTKLSDLQSRFR